ncbi:MAG: ABC transporter permease [Pseudomonadota bacterium]
MNDIALKILWADLGKAAAMILGVAFSTLLMAQQAAIFVCLIGNTASHISAAQDVDIWVADGRADYFDDPGALPAALAQRVKSVAGVAYAAPFIRMNVVLDSNDFVEQGILVGVEADTLMGAPQKMLQGAIASLRSTDTFVIDGRGYSDIWPGEELRLGRILEVDGRRLRLVGIVDPPSPFISMPLIYTSTATAALVRPGVSPGFVVVRAEESAQAAPLAQAISEQTGYGAFDKDAFAQMTIDYYLDNTGIPINFAITITLGFIVGAAIVAQTFYLFVTENLRHLAVFKAMGANARQLITMTAIQCVSVAVIGFGLGIAGAAYFFETVPEKITAFKGFYLPWGIFVKVGLVVLGISLVSGLISIQRAVRFAPAHVIRG